MPKNEPLILYCPAAELAEDKSWPIDKGEKQQPTPNYSLPPTEPTIPTIKGNLLLIIGLVVVLIVLVIMLKK